MFWVQRCFADFKAHYIKGDRLATSSIRVLVVDDSNRGESLGSAMLETKPELLVVAEVGTDWKPFKQPRN